MSRKHCHHLTPIGSNYNPSVTSYMIMIQPWQEGVWYILIMAKYSEISDSWHVQIKIQQKTHDNQIILKMKTLLEASTYPVSLK